MKLGRCTAYNFSSYKQLSFDFHNLGLTIVQGPTGSGKSTLFDLPCWILYGITSKNTSVDEIRMWGATGVTSGELDVTTKNGTQIKIRRVRGLTKDNDLYWVENDIVKRGKDLKDTQKQINEMLGVDSTLYQYSSYFSEFSPSAIFFMAPSKLRRQLLESLTDLSFSREFQELAKLRQRSLKFEVEGLERSVLELQHKISHIYESIDHGYRHKEEWIAKQTKLVETIRESSKSFSSEKNIKIAQLNENKQKFERNKAEKINLAKSHILDLQKRMESMKTDSCPTCGADSPDKKEMSVYKRQVESQQKSMYMTECSLFPDLYVIKALEISDNPYTKEIQTELNRENPFTYKLVNLNNSLEVTKNSHLKKQQELTLARYLQFDMNTLLETSYAMTNYLLQKSISDLKDLSNHYLGTYFGGEFIIDLSLEGSDDLEVTINKNGNLCSYAQLSKGQRALLKLCFSVAIMKISANNAGISFDNIFLDEALDGFDPELKIKAIDMLYSMSEEHSSVMVIDHSSELKASIDNKISVKLVGDRSELEQS